LKEYPGGESGLKGLLIMPFKDGESSNKTNSNHYSNH